MSEPFISLFDVVDGDPDHTKLRTIKNDFVEMKSTVKAAMDSGLPPDEMKVANLLYLGIQRGMEILETF